MKTEKQLKEGQKVSARQLELIQELQTIAKDMERCQNTITELQTELAQVNERHANRKTTQEDINYLEDLLSCAKKKLVWEKQMASLKKRTPELMQRIEALVNHPESNPSEETRAALLQSLQNVQAGMNRLHNSSL